MTNHRGEQRLCTQCEEPALPRLVGGINKGYYKTCQTHFGYHHKIGPNHCNATKLGRRYTEDGYIQILDPTRDKAKKTGSNYVAEHRYVMSQSLGRPLEKNEVVHHKNGVRDDNRIENLALIGPGDHHESRTLIKALQQRIRDLEVLISNTTRK